jgi:drug/metabolite transporter (DMT)-like permease
MRMQNANQAEIAAGVSKGIMSAVTSLAGLYGLYLLFTAYPTLSLGIAAVLIAALVLWWLGAWAFGRARHWGAGAWVGAIVVGFLIAGGISNYFDAAPNTHAAPGTVSLETAKRVQTLKPDLLKADCLWARQNPGVAPSEERDCKAAGL